MHLYTFVYKSFSNTLDKGLRKNIKKKDGEIGEHKWNGSTEYEIEKVKLEKSEWSSNHPVVFKHDY